MLLSRLKQSGLGRLTICGLRIPYYYLVSRGHIAMKGGLSVDREGNYIPWITYPAMDFLDNVDFADCSVFEFGSGSSTLWWSRKAKHVTSVEMDLAWYQKMARLLPQNVHLAHVPDGGLYPDTISEFKERFDVVVIDGAERYKCANAAVKRASDRAIIILDNTEWYPNTAEKLRDLGYAQIDFHGLSPGNSFPSLTSLFFKSTGLLARRVSPARPVIGGNDIPGGALDDA